jgi:hypothetical protein
MRKIQKKRRGVGNEDNAVRKGSTNSPPLDSGGEHDDSGESSPLWVWIWRARVRGNNRMEVEWAPGTGRTEEDNVITMNR